jgi:hypothetical protein
LERFFIKGRKMKVLAAWALGAALLLFLCWTSYRELSRAPIRVFLVEKSSDGIDVFQVNLFLSGTQGQIMPLGLTGAQKKQLQEAYDQKNMDEIARVGQAVNAGKIVVGVLEPMGDWPWFIGGGLKGLVDNENNDVFDNLTLFDRIYLCLTTAPPFGLPMAGVKISTNPPEPVSNFAPVPTVSQNSGGVVRVKILNGCGITNAADWVAGRLKGPGIVISEVTNADQFHYPKTLVRSSIGIPVALQEALERLGLAQEVVDETGASEADADVVVVVGKDYLNLRGKARERSHNGKK